MFGFLSDDPKDMSYYYPLIAALFLVCGVLGYFSSGADDEKEHKNNEKASKLDKEEHNNRQTPQGRKDRTKRSLSLQFRYLLAYTLMRTSNWCKAPYKYILFKELLNFSMAEIGFLFVIEAFSTLTIGPIFGYFSDKSGRKLICIIYCVMSISVVVLRLTGNVPLAYIAQILSGINADFIVTTFESWLNYEVENEYGKEEKESILKGLFKSQNIFETFGSISVSIIAAVTYTYFRIIGPMIISIAIVTGCMVSVIFLWDENKPGSEHRET